MTGLRAIVNCGFSGKFLKHYRPCQEAHASDKRDSKWDLPVEKTGRPPADLGQVYADCGRRRFAALAAEPRCKATVRQGIAETRGRFHLSCPISGVHFAHLDRSIARHRLSLAGNIQISAWCRAKASPEHRDERARILVPHLHCNVGYALAGGHQLQGAKNP